MLNLDLKNHLALVGGATQGIGKAIAVELARQGVELVLLARNEEKLQKTLEALPRHATQLHHRYVVANYADPHSFDLALDRLRAMELPVSILINNTGGPLPGPVAEASGASFLEAFQQHLVCNQKLVQLSLPAMRRRGYGRIVNIISTSVKQPLDNLGVSNTVRAGVANWAKTLANELGADGITVNNVLPGATRTPRLDSIIQNSAKKAGTNMEQAGQNIKASIPAGRFGTPEELAYAVAFLASPYAAYINGINLPVDGGKTGAL